MSNSASGAAPPPDFVLIVSLGRTDVQVVADLEGRPRRVSLRNDSQRAFHAACERGEIAWDIQPLLEPLPDEDKSLGFVYEPEQRVLRLRSESGVFLRRDALEAFHIDCQNHVRLCAPLLAKVCGHIRARQDQGTLGRALHVLLLTTDREAAQDNQGEPFAAARILRDKLAAALGLAPTAIEECVFLRAGRIDEIDEAGQAHCRRDAVRALDAAIFRLAREHPRAHALVSTTGGLPITKAPIEEACRHRFENRVFFTSAIEGPRNAARAPQRLLSPVESLNTRRRVRALARGGAFGSAAALSLADLENFDPALEPWRSWLADVAQVVEDGAPLPPVSAAWDGQSRMRERLVKIQQLGPVPLLAFRIENALRRDHLAAALREMFTLFDDVAVWQAVKNFFSEPNGSCIDWNTARFDLAKTDARHQGQLMAALGATAPVSLRFGQKIRKNGKETPLKSLLFNEISRNSKLRTAVARGRSLLGLSIDPLNPQGETLRGVRNHIAHGAATRPQLEAAAAVLEREKCWDRGGPYRFLQCDVPLQLFNALVLQHLALFYEQLLKAIFADMEEFSLLDPP